MTRKELEIGNFEYMYKCKWRENLNRKGFYITTDCGCVVDVGFSDIGKEYYIDKNCMIWGDFLEDLIKIIHLYYLGEKNE